MITSKIKGTKPADKPFTFPMLAGYYSDGVNPKNDPDFVVLLVSAKAGVVVHSSNPSWTVGNFNSTWSFADVDMKRRWAKFDRPITLKNG